MKTLLACIVGFSIPVCLGEFVSIWFESDSGETVFFMAEPMEVRLSKQGGFDTKVLRIDESGYSDIREEFREFIDTKSSSLGESNESIEEIKNIHIAIENEEKRTEYSMTGSVDDISVLLDAFRIQIGDREVDRFLNKFIVQPITSSGADKPPV